jgi:hypothetical protein
MQQCTGEAAQASAALVLAKADTEQAQAVAAESSVQLQSELAAAQRETAALQARLLQLTTRYSGESRGLYMQNTGCVHLWTLHFRLLSLKECLRAAVQDNAVS